MHNRIPFPLTLLLLFLSLLLSLVVAADFDFAVPRRTPSPPGAPAPAPVPVSVPKNVASNRGSLQLPPAPPHVPLSCERDCYHGPSQRLDGIDLAPALGMEGLNFGEKLGLALAGIAIVLQVVLGSFLVFKRIQFRNLQYHGVLER